MAAITEHLSDRAGFLNRALSAMAEWMDSFGRARDAAHEIDHLYSLSDKALAARGLTREALPQYIATRYVDV